jgi:hypothetical protein
MAGGGDGEAVIVAATSNLWNADEVAMPDAIIDRITSNTAICGGRPVRSGDAYSCQ